ncbi:DUF222 domain-containing protein [Actinoplanes solisilvae]|uniref:DUF222 domain-containing protein n=1 Tax=Actinoplanes solisilvae TaxID=2486853 RepID=UPI003D7A66DC
MPDSEITSLLRAANRLEQTAVLLQARLIREACGRGLPIASGHRSAAVWLSGLLRLDPDPARKLTKLAAALADRHDVERAVLAGEVNIGQAAVIAATVANIPATLAAFDDPGPNDAGGPPAGFDGPPAGFDGPPAGFDGPPAGADGPPADADGPPADADGPSAGTRHEPLSLAGTRRIAEQAEAKMIELAAQFPAHLLNRAGERILAHVAPELADRADELALERQQARAHRKRSFTLALPVDGLARVSGLLDAEAAAIVQAALHPLCRPIAGDNRPMSQRRADALVEICNLALRTGELPTDGGEPPQLTVTVPYDILARAVNFASDGFDNPSALPARPTGARHPSAGNRGSTAASGAGASSGGCCGSAAASGADEPLADTRGSAATSTADIPTTDARFTVAPDPDQPVTDDVGAAAAATAAGFGRPATDAGPAAVYAGRAAARAGAAGAGRPASDAGSAVTAVRHYFTGALSSGITDTGIRLSASTVRRLACEARILPAVLGGHSQVLDLGRSRRLARGALRRALHIRDRGCAFPDCDRPPRWTDVHHLVSWINGGLTCLDNTVLLCRAHHRLIHHPTAGWQVRLGADGHPVFIPPSSIDPLRRPLRNLYHRHAQPLLGSAERP